MRMYLALGATVAAAAVIMGRQLRKYGVDGHRLEHACQTEASYRSAGTRILILGAGFGGLAAALKLDQQER